MSLHYLSLWRFINSHCSQVTSAAVINNWRSWWNRASSPDRRGRFWPVDAGLRSASFIMVLVEPFLHVLLTNEWRNTNDHSISEANPNQCWAMQLHKSTTFLALVELEEHPPPNSLLSVCHKCKTWKKNDARGWKTRWREADARLWSSKTFSRTKAWKANKNKRKKNRRNQTTNLEGELFRVFTSRVTADVGQII